MISFEFALCGLVSLPIVEAVKVEIRILMQWVLVEEIGPVDHFEGIVGIVETAVLLQAFSDRIFPPIGEFVSFWLVRKPMNSNDDFGHWMSASYKHAPEIALLG